MAEGKRKDTADKAPDAAAETSYAQLHALLRREVTDLRTQLETSLTDIGLLNEQLVTFSAPPVRPIELGAVIDRCLHVTRLLGSARALGWDAALRPELPGLEQQVAALETSEAFDAAWYMAQNADIAGTGISAQEHYIRSGAYEGRDPGPGFSTMHYYVANPDVAAAGWPALVHHALFGKDEGRPLIWSAAA